MFRSLSNRHSGGALDPAALRYTGRGDRRSAVLEGAACSRTLLGFSTQAGGRKQSFSSSLYSALKPVETYLEGFADGIGNSRKNRAFNSIRVDPETLISFKLLSVHWMPGPAFSIHNASTQQPVVLRSSPYTLSSSLLGHALMTFTIDPTIFVTDHCLSHRDRVLRVNCPDVLLQVILADRCNQTTFHYAWKDLLGVTVHAVDVSFAVVLLAEAISANMALMVSSCGSTFGVGGRAAGCLAPLITCRLISAPHDAVEVRSLLAAFRRLGQHRH